MITTAIVHSIASLAAYADTIRNEFAVVIDSERRSIPSYRKIGEALIAAKELCGHGKWLPWLKANVPFSVKHAQRYIKLAKCDVTSHLAEQWAIIQGNSPETKEETSKKTATKPVPSSEPEADPSQWAAISVQLDNLVVSLSITSSIPTEAKPWQLVESLERTGRALLLQARDLRKRHKLK